MADVDIRFERENLDGIVAVGTYLKDAERRMGIIYEPDCLPAQAIHFCEIVVTTGADHLSAVTKTETKHFASAGRKQNERLACEARIEKPGSIVVMTKEKVQEPEEEQKKSPLQDEFAELPLEQKIANLLKMEAVTLGETFSFIVNSPFKVFEKVGDVMAEFGVKLENAAREAGRPEEHKAETKAQESAATNGKTRTRKKPAPKTT